MLDRILIFLIKRFVLVWDRNSDKLAILFWKNETTDYMLTVRRYYEDYYTVGTATYQYPNSGADMRDEK